jgi:hypothetical protein
MLKILLLKNNIVKVLYVKTPINIPNIDKFKKLCYSNNQKMLSIKKYVYTICQ